MVRDTPIRFVLAFVSISFAALPLPVASAQSMGAWQCDKDPVTTVEWAATHAQELAAEAVASAVPLAGKAKCTAYEAVGLCSDESLPGVPGVPASTGGRHAHRALCYEAVAGGGGCRPSERVRHFVDAFGTDRHDCVSAACGFGFQHPSVMGSPCGYLRIVKGNAPWYFTRHLTSLTEIEPTIGGVRKAAGQYCIGIGGFSGDAELRVIVRWGDGYRTDAWVDRYDGRPLCHVYTPQIAPYALCAYAGGYGRSREECWEIAGASFYDAYGAVHPDSMCAVDGNGGTFGYYDCRDPSRNLYDIALGKLWEHKEWIRQSTGVDPYMYGWANPQGIWR